MAPMVEPALRAVDWPVAPCAVLVGYWVFLVAFLAPPDPATQGLYLPPLFVVGTVLGHLLV